MHIPRHHFGTAYNRLKRSSSSTVPSVLILTSLDVDSLCACRMFTRLLKADYIPHKLHPVAGYQDLTKANNDFIVNNDDLRFLVLLGVGGLIDLAEFVNLRKGIEVWVIESRRPWNLQNMFAGAAGEGYGVVGKDGYVGEDGGVVCWDDGDIGEFLKPEEEAFKGLIEMQEEVGDLEDWSSGDDEDDDDDDEEEELGSGRRNGLAGLLENEDTPSSTNSRKRRSPSDDDDDEEDGYSDEDRRRRKRIHSGSSTPNSSPHAYSSLLHIRGPPAGATTTTLLTSAPSKKSVAENPKAARKRFLALKRKHSRVLTDYYSHGSTYGEPISSLVYSLASELGREDNDLLWLAIVGWEGQQMYGRHMHSFSGSQTINSVTARGIGVWGVLRDEVRRLNPPNIGEKEKSLTSNTSLFTRAATAEDYSLRLSSEFRFLLIRHWSLYDSMLHSPYLAAKLHVWSEHGKKRLHKMLATMGMSLAQCNQKYVFMDMDLKKNLREKLDTYAGRYGLDEVVREGVVRCWGWNACLSAGDVAVVMGSLLEVGKGGGKRRMMPIDDKKKNGKLGKDEDEVDANERLMEEEVQEVIENFQAAYDSLEDVEAIKTSLPLAMSLHRSILNIGTALIEKRQVKHLRAYRLAIVKEGPDVQLFTHPSALTKLALWLAEAIREQELEKGGSKKRGLPLVVAALNETRGVYVIVGTGTGAIALKDQNLEGRKVDIDRENRIKSKKEKKEEKRRKRREMLEKEGLDADELDALEEEEEEEESESDSDDEDDDDDDGAEDGGLGGKGRKVLGRNRFGIAFQEVANETSARVRIDSFEACVVEVKKDDLGGFLEGLSMKSIVG